MEQIQVTLEVCTLFKGVPYGVSLIQYNDPKDKALSFKGLGFFNDGKLNSSPFTAVDGNGVGLSFSKMENGRPADGSYHTWFNENGCEYHVDSKEAKTDVSGW